MRAAADVLAGDGRPGWIGYIGVEDVDAATEGVRLAGGPSTGAPADIPDIGRFSVVADPQGAVFVLFTPLGGDRSPAPAEHRVMSAGTSSTRRTGRKRSTSTPGSSAGPSGCRRHGPDGHLPALRRRRHTDRRHDEQARRNPSPAWLYYFNVAEADAAAARVTEHGGQILNGPQQVPGRLDPALPGSARSDVRARRPRTAEGGRGIRPEDGMFSANVGDQALSSAGFARLGMPPGCRPPTRHPARGPGRPAERWRCGVTNQSVPVAASPGDRRFGSGGMALGRDKPPQGRRPGPERSLLARSRS